MSILIEQFIKPILSELTASIKLQASQDSNFATHFNEDVMLIYFQEACKKLTTNPLPPTLHEELAITLEPKLEPIAEEIQASIKEEDCCPINVREAVLQTLDTYRGESFTIKTIKQRIIEDFCLAPNALRGKKQEIQTAVIEFFSREKYIAEGIAHYEKEHKKLGITANLVDIQYKVIRKYEEIAKPKQTFIDYFADDYKAKANQWECPNCLCNVSNTVTTCPACEYQKQAEEIKETLQVEQIEKEGKKKAITKPKAKQAKKEKSPVPQKHTCGYKDCSVQPKTIRLLSDGKCYCAKHHKQMEKKLSK